MKIVLSQARTDAGGFPRSFSEKAVGWLLDKGVDRSLLYVEVGGLRRREVIYVTLPRSHPLLVECVERLGTGTGPLGQAHRIENVQGPYVVIPDFLVGERVVQRDTVDWQYPE